MVVPMPSLMQMVPGADLLPRILRVVRAGATCAPRELAEWLADAGYTRTETIENPGDFAVRGGVMDILYRIATQQDLQAPRTWSLTNTAINRLLWTPQSVTLGGSADTSHLGEDSRDEY